MKCHKLNHFAVKCRGDRKRKIPCHIKAVDDTEDHTEIFQVSNVKVY